MRSTFIFAICNCLFSAILIASPAFSQKLSETKVSIDFKGETLNNCIKQIEQKTDIQFVFNPDDLKAESSLLFKFKQTSVKEILSVLLENSNLKFEEFGGKIVIYNHNTESINNLLFSEISAHEISKVSLSTINEIAQQNTVTGKIVDAKGEAVPAVTVNVKGTTRSSISNENGLFTIQANETDILVFSSIGFITKEVLVGNTKSLNIKLETSSSNIDEVVVVGYSTVKRSELTAAISTVKGEAIKNQPVRSVAEALQGRVAGVYVTNEGGEPGKEANIIIRGPVNTRGAGPLYVIDGIPFTEAGNSFNMQDVEDIQIIKDASAAAIYGSRAAGGVIIVTTKKGKAGDLIVSANATIGTRKAINLPRMLSKDEFITARTANGDNINGKYFGPASEIPNLPNTNWNDYLYKTAIEQNYTVSLSGGNNKSTYFMSANFNDQQGIRVDNFVKRYAIRINSEHKINKRLKIAQNFYLSSENENPSNIPNLGAMSYRTSPIMNVLDPTNVEGGGWGKVPSYFTNAGNDYMGEFVRYGRNNSNVANLAFNAELEIIKDLKIRQNVALKYGFSDDYYYEFPFDVGSNSPRNQANSKFGKEFGKSLDLIANTTLNYSKKIGSHSFTALAGFEALKSKDSKISGYAQDSNTPLNLDFEFVKTRLLFNTVAGAGADNYRLNSLFGNLTYNYDSKYYFNANVRRDGVSTKFGPRNKYGVFPSASLMWRVVNEDFMKDNKVFSDFKFRASYGLLGNSDIPDFLFLNTYTGGFPTVLGPNGPILNSFGINTQIANAAIQWENVTTTNLGLDFGFFKNALTLSLEFYSRQTKKMVYDVPISLSAGQGESLSTNIGQMSNKGIEVMVNYNGKVKKDFTYNVGVNGSFNTNKLITLDPRTGGQFFDGGLNEIYGSSTSSKTEPGKPLGQFYGWVTDGIYQTKADADKGPLVGQDLYKPREGDLIYKDINGDGFINNEDKQYIGNPWPKLNFGINLGVQYKRFDLSALLTGILGVDIYNAQQSYNHVFQGDYNTTTDIFNTSLFNGNGITEFPRGFDPQRSGKFAGKDPNGNWSKVSSYHVKDGSFMRMRNIQLGYNFSTNLLKRIGTSSARLFIMADNLFIITKYNGYDPEIGGKVRERGIDNSSERYPTTRYFSAGINLSL